MCEFRKITSYHEISLINKNEDYNTFVIQNDLNDITDIDLTFPETKSKRSFN